MTLAKRALIAVMCSSFFAASAWDATAAPPPPPAPPKLPGDARDASPDNKPGGKVIVGTKEDKEAKNTKDDKTAKADKDAANSGEDKGGDDKPGKGGKKIKGRKSKHSDSEDEYLNALSDGKFSEDVASIGDHRIKFIPYDEADVYTITTKYGYQTNIVFSATEEIELISVGDRSLWQIIPSGNRIFIRPMEEDVITNMTVITNKHSYQFDLKSMGSDQETGNIYVAKFTYDAPKGHAPETLPPAMASPPAEELGAVPSFAPPASSPFGVSPSIPANASVMPPAGVPAPDYAPQPSAQPAGGPSPVMPAMTSPAAYPNYRYTYAGPDDLAPLQVYDDGKSTYMKYADVTRLTPSPFVILPSGQQMPVSYTIKGDFIVVDAVAGEILLKSGGNVIHIFNETINPG